MSNEPTPARRQLIAGLVGERGNLYHSSAQFYHTINALADLLPLWVKGIAVQAVGLDERLKAQVELMEYGGRVVEVSDVE